MYANMNESIVIKVIITLFYSLKLITYYNIILLYNHTSAAISYEYCSVHLVFIKN